MNINLLLYLLFIASPFSVLIHELGHAIAAISIKSNNSTISIGSGEKLFSVQLKRINIVIHRIYFIGGYTQNNREVPYQPGELIWLTILGPIFNGIAACLIYLMMDLSSNAYIHLLMWFNIWLATANLLPLRIGEKQTDGYIIFQIVRGRL